MKNILTSILLLTVLATTMDGCKKLSDDNSDIYKYVPPPAKPISNETPLCGSVSGTMLAGKTYTVGCDVYDVLTNGACMYVSSI